MPVGRLKTKGAPRVKPKPLDGKSHLNLDANGKPRLNTLQRKLADAEDRHIQAKRDLEDVQRQMKRQSGK